jgi:hypothetical protein
MALDETLLGMKKKESSSRWRPFDVASCPLATFLPDTMLDYA